jgi:hypothetical protein
VVDAAKRAELLDHYEAGYDAVANAINGMTERELDNRESPQEWSSRELIHHYAESEMVAAIRLRRLIAEDNPVIVPYDQDDYARVLFYDRPAESSLRAFEFALKTNVQIMRRMPGELWTKGGIHPESGPFDLNRFVEMYSPHGVSHTDQFARARAGTLHTPVSPRDADRPDDLTRLIERYERGHLVVMESLAGASGADLDVREAPGEWSPRQVAHHLADSETASVMRFRRLLAEDRPLIQSYDQDAYAARLYYERPIEDSLQLFRYARETAALMLRRLDASQWARTGIHSDDGEFAVVDWLKSYVEHAENHADQIRRARATTT